MAIPIRLYSYQFGPNDYEAYEHQRAALLSSPRGRAALPRGGIVARLANEHLSLDTACFGPSSFVSTYGVGFSVVNDAGTRFWDDDLTDDELKIICGVHRCYTGKQRCRILVFLHILIIVTRVWDAGSSCFVVAITQSMDELHRKWLQLASLDRMG